MLKSMTGFGKAICQLPTKSIVIEIRTLNSKTLDLGIRLPAIYKGFEQEVRNLLSMHLRRGKVDFLLGFENGHSPAETTINIPLAEKYMKEISVLYEKLGLSPGSDLVPAILRFPDIFSQPDADLAAGEWEQIRPAIQQAIEQTNAFRASEGKYLEDDLVQRVRNIGMLLNDIGQHEDNRKEGIMARLKKSLQEMGENIHPDQNRFEQELVYYLEKIDISEEKVRLARHLEYFEETLADDDAAGKKLGFIVQEAGREINTIGSKANHADIQRIVVQMKDELEKIREQLMNVL